MIFYNHKMLDFSFLENDKIFEIDLCFDTGKKLNLTFLYYGDYFRHGAGIAKW